MAKHAKQFRLKARHILGTLLALVCTGGLAWVLYTPASAPVHHPAESISFRPAALRKPAAQVSEPSRAPAAAKVTTYTVKPGDTLSGISEKFCGTASDWPSLARASSVPDPDEISPGKVLTIIC
jgi:nucleoid-associated protein YgaU